MEKRKSRWQPDSAPMPPPISTPSTPKPKSCAFRGPPYTDYSRTSATVNRKVTQDKELIVIHGRITWLTRRNFENPSRERNWLTERVQALPGAVLKGDPLKLSWPSAIRRSELRSR